MRAPLTLALLALRSCLTSASDKHDRQKELEARWSQDWAFSGISTFAHLPYVRCLTTPGQAFDVAIVGAPFDSAVSYRPGARFGPRAIRAASSRQSPLRGFNPRAGHSPYHSWATIIDCGDIPITPFDKSLALRQMTAAFTELGSHRPASTAHHAIPKLVTLGGDHSLSLPALRALRKLHGQPITVLHFDAHLDTWDPTAYPSSGFDDDRPPVEQDSAFNHGSMFWLAWNEGLLSNASTAGLNVHAGLRTRLRDWGDYEDDSRQGWHRIDSDAISADLKGPGGVAGEILDIIGTERPVYLSVDIDVLDPGLAPGTGTPEPGGWMTRELVRVLRAVEALNIVGADVVEVSPGYDGQGEQTALAAAQVVFEILTSIVGKGRDVGEAKAGAAGDSLNGRDEL